LQALLDYLHIERSVVIGLSMGGGFAIDFALDHPRMTAALVAADTALSGFDWPHGRPSAWQAETARRDGVAAAKQEWLDCALFKPVARRPAVATRLAAQVSSYSGWHWLNDNPIVLTGGPASDRLSAISCPTLIVVGELDEPDFHSVAAHLRQNIRDSAYICIPDVGHMSNMEDPVAFNRALSTFLKSSAFT
jgi:pimeloyl-ACP methyl ester carboxylesterase